MSASHELAVISCSNWIYPLGDRVAEAKDSSPHANIYKDFHRLDASLKAGIPSGGKEQHQQQGSLSRSLSMALAFINRLSSSTSTSNYYTSRRILLISSTRDSPSSYIPTMNCIFSSQKMGVPIDVVRLFAAKTSFLAHASLLTKGLFLNIPDPDTDLLHVLMYAFLPDQQLRHSTMTIPSQENVDYRAACFCHKKIVDMGFVCSVCLSIFCSYQQECSTCSSTF